MNKPTNLKKIAILAGFPHSALEGDSSGRGGGQACTWLPQLALNFREQDEFEIHWISLKRKSFKSKVTKKWGQYFHQVGAFPMSVDIATNCMSAKIVLKRAIKKIQPDLLHVWGSESIYPCVLPSSTLPSILSMQGVISYYQKIGGLDNSKRWKQMAASEPEYMKAATLVTSESQWGIDRVLEVAPGIETEMVEYGVHPSFYDLKWNPDTKNPYCIFVGSDGFRKGVPLLVEAMKTLGDTVDWKLKLAGVDKNCEDMLEAHQTNTEALGMLGWDKLRKLLVGAQCLVLPTWADTSPNVVKEARVVGLPVVTTVHGGQSGYIHHNENGLIVEPLNAANLKENLELVMGDLKTARMLGNCHHERDREYLHSSNTASAFLNIYKDMLL